MFRIGQQLKTQALGGLSKLRGLRNVSYMGFLKPNEGAVTSYKRLGRGPASGKGKTSGRGQKGQKARGKVPRWLEGGQTPYYKLFPIIGFKRPHRKVYFDLNLDRIQEFWNTGRIPLEAGQTLTIKIMKDCGLITGTMKDGVKILANGKEDYNVPLSIEASRASEQAIIAIEKLGQTYTSMYFTPLSLRAHLDPDAFLLKKGYVPLPARPTHRRDIQYYSNPDKRGYLLKDRSLLLDHLKSAGATYTKADRKTSLERQLEAASDKRHTEFTSGRVVTLDDL